MAVPHNWSVVAREKMWLAASLLFSGGDWKMNVRSVVYARASVLLMFGPALAEGANANGGNGHHYGWGKGTGGDPAASPAQPPAGGNKNPVAMP